MRHAWKYQTTEVPTQVNLQSIPYTVIMKWCCTSIYNFRLRVDYMNSKPCSICVVLSFHASDTVLLKAGFEYSRTKSFKHMEPHKVTSLPNSPGWCKYSSKNVVILTSRIITIRRIIRTIRENIATRSFFRMRPEQHRCDQGTNRHENPHCVCSNSASQLYEENAM